MTINQYLMQPVSQQILMDMHGFILDSSDTIFAVERHRPATEWSLFLASIMPSLKGLRLDSPEIHFPCIDSITDSLSGLYDCSFIFVEWGDDKWVLVWNIFDFTKSAKHLQKRQQHVHNEALKQELAFVA